MWDDCEVLIHPKSIVTLNSSVHDTPPNHQPIDVQFDVEVRVQRATDEQVMASQMRTAAVAAAAARTARSRAEETTGAGAGAGFDDDGDDIIDGDSD